MLKDTKTCYFQCLLNSKFSKLKDIQLPYYLLDFVRKSILYAKITLSQKKFVSKLDCKQTARLIFS